MATWYVACSSVTAVVMRTLLLALASAVAVSGTPALIDLPGVSSVAGKAAPETVVWLEAPGAKRAKPEKAVLDQRNLSFSPRVMAVQVGTRVEFPNSDRVFHNVFSTHDSSKFDLGLYPVGAVKHVPFDRPGLSRVFCNIHPQMAAYVMVLETPYFAVSGDHGEFVIRDVPAGTYRYHAWRPGAAIIKSTVTVAADTRLHVQWP